MKKPKITIRLIDQKGHMGCHHGHQIGDVFDFDTDRGSLWRLSEWIRLPRRAMELFISPPHFSLPPHTASPPAQTPA